MQVCMYLCSHAYRIVCVRACVCVNRLSDCPGLVDGVLALWDVPLRRLFRKPVCVCVCVCVCVHARARVHLDSSCACVRVSRVRDQVRGI